MGGATHVDRAGDVGDPAIADASDVVRVDVKTDGAISSGRGARCAARSERFSEQHRYAAMEDADGMASARVDRGTGADKVIANLQKFDAEMRDRRVEVELGERIDGDRLLPNGSHGAT